MLNEEEKSLLAPQTIQYKISDRDKERETTLMKEIISFFGNHKGSPKEAYNDLISQTPIQDGTELKEVNIDTIKGWWCIPAQAAPDKVILYVHGGAYALGSAKAFRGLGSKIASLTGMALFLVEYPLSDEASFPAAPNAVMNAYQWLLTQGAKSIVVMGDSAGGGLTLATLQQLAATPEITQPAGAVVFSPWTDLTLTGASWTDSAISDALINYDTLKESAAAYAGDIDIKTPGISPLYGSMKGLPPLLIQVSANEHLLDDSVNLANAAAKEGIQVRLEIWEAMHHVFQNDFEHLECGKDALEKASEFVKDIFKDYYFQTKL
ncbi:alpha/beta hydrolase [Chryseobacterium sp. JK1]|uniref:alpha/beta hydrolase n=1 Tax=Chryseobacterium sp. JK1 TaxID=874294 RepID=UPI003D68E657